VAAAVAASLALIGLTSAGPAAAVNAPHSVVVSDNPVNFTPHVRDGAVKAVTQVGNKIIAAGTFTQVSQTASGTIISRNRIFAFDATTGVIDAAFNPNLNGAANSLDTDGTYIYVGGTFSTVGGVSAQRVAKLTSTGQLVTNGAGGNLLRAPNSAVNEVVVRGSRLYVGGAFSSVGGTARQRLAALDTDTGAVLADVDVPFTGVYDPAIGGTTNIKRFDVTADGSKLIAVGNFSSVGGQTRSQIAMLDLPATGAATVSPWATDRFDAGHNDCATVFDTFMRDVDFSPDGSYFAVTTTGAFAGGAASGTMCDTSTRWETGPAAAGRQPTWVNYTGGDTSYGVAITGTAIYVGGHQRWQNNPFQGDQAGPGAVPREGIAALDPVNGLPLSWNPGRSRGVGAEALYATSQGLWVGSDTDRIGGETHRKIALMPLAGGTAVPPVDAATLPNDLFGAERGGTGVLFRVNAGGPALASIDGGPGWSADTALTSPYRNAGSNVAEWGAGHTVDATVPGGTPPAVFNNERWDPVVVPEMSWDFPVTAGRSVKVRLYFANRYSGTSQPGQRVFDVRIDNVTRLDNYDIVADVGHARGTMKEFTVTGDGNVDIDFLHGVENPLISAIEIVDSAATGTALLRRPVDGAGVPTGPATPANTAMDWSTVRGAALINGTLYYGLSNGSVYARGFDAATGGFTTAQRTVNLYDDPDDGSRIPFAIGSLSGLFYDPDTHRLYYTVTGDPQLYFRYFTPESEVVGAEQFVAARNGVDFSSVGGLTLASGKIFYGSTSDGSLRGVTFAGGAVTGTPSVTSSDGSWKYRALFLRNG
jgi:hypothetical protein